jgi:hypothetical protein
MARSTHEGPGVEPDAPIDAGPFAEWAVATAVTLRVRGTSDVPCGTCTACCTSYQFVLIEPDEHDTMARIHSDLLVPAPGLPPGHRVLGHDAEGRCPMLIDDACSIYEDRPRTCRTYDCRVLAATDLAGEVTGAQAAIGEQAARWRFRFERDADRRRHAAVQASLDARRVEVAARPGPGPTPAQLAARAVERHADHLG